MAGDIVTSKLQSARHAIAKAEADLETALNEVQVAPRAEKIAISQVLEVAVQRVRELRVEVANLEALILEHDI
jgi:hypothetical protein